LFDDDRLATLPLPDDARHAKQAAADIRPELSMQPKRTELNPQYRSRSHFFAF
jgi:hypothetical protein